MACYVCVEYLVCTLFYWQSIHYIRTKLTIQYEQCTESDSNEGKQYFCFTSLLHTSYRTHVELHVRICYDILYKLTWINKWINFIFIRSEKIIYWYVLKQNILILFRELNHFGVGIKFGIIGSLRLYYVIMF